jgi:hypothetical protein
VVLGCRRRTGNLSIQVWDSRVTAFFSRSEAENPHIVPVLAIIDESRENRFLGNPTEIQEAFGVRRLRQPARKEECPGEWP